VIVKRTLDGWMDEGLDGMEWSDGTSSSMNTAVEWVSAPLIVLPSRSRLDGNGLGDSDSLDGIRTGIVRTVVGAVVTTIIGVVGRARARAGAGVGGSIVGTSAGILLDGNAALGGGEGSGIGSGEVVRGLGPINKDALLQLSVTCRAGGVRGGELDCLSSEFGGGLAGDANVDARRVEFGSTCPTISARLEYGLLFGDV